MQFRKETISFTLYNIIMDQINPTLVLITFSFIWLIKLLTCHCILEVKIKLLWSFFQKHVLVHLKCSHRVKLFLRVFFFSLYCTLSMLLLKNRYNEKVLHRGSRYMLLLNNLSPSCHLLSATFRLVSMHFSFNWN